MGLGVGDRVGCAVRGTFGWMFLSGREVVAAEVGLEVVEFGCGKS